MRINMKQFQKIGENRDSATLRNERGHQITLSKKSLAPHLRKSVESLPLCLAYGSQTEVEDPKKPADAPPPPDDKSDPHGMAEQIGYWVGKHGVPAVQEAIHVGLGPERAMLQGAQNVYSGIQKGLGIQQDPDQEAPTPGAAQPMAAGAGMAAPDPNAQPGSAAPGMIPQGQQASGVPAPGGAGMPPMDTEPLPDAYGDFKRESKGYADAMMAQAKAEGDLGNKQAAQYKEFGDAQKNAFMDYQNQMQDINMERQNLINDLKNQHINPNHYTENMSTGAKVATTIGVLLSGLGSGLTGKDNLAMKVMNEQIERDINAQKENIGLKNNLLAANYHREGSLQNAMTMTRINLNDIMAHKINEEAARSAYPMAKDKAAMAIHLFNAQNAGLMNQLYMQRQQMRQQRSAMQQLSGGQASDPENRINLMLRSGMISGKDADAAGKELNAVKNHAKQADAVLSAFDNAVKENTAMGRAGRMGAEPPSMKNYRSLIMPYLKDAEGRINETELKRTDAFLKGVGDRNSTVTEKRQGLVQFLNEKTPEATHLKRVGINPEQFGRNNSSGQSKFKAQEGAPVKAKK